MVPGQYTKIISRTDPDDEPELYFCQGCQNDYSMELNEDGLCGNCTDLKKCENCENFFCIEDLEGGLCETCIERAKAERDETERFENAHGYGYI